MLRYKNYSVYSFHFVSILDLQVPFLFNPMKLQNIFSLSNGLRTMLLNISWTRDVNYASLFALLKIILPCCTLGNLDCEITDVW